MTQNASIHPIRQPQRGTVSTSIAPLNREDGGCFGFELTGRGSGPRLMIACHGPHAREAFQAVLFDWAYFALRGQLSLVLLDEIEAMTMDEIARFSTHRRSQHHVQIIEAKDHKITAAEIRESCERLGLLKRGRARLQQAARNRPPRMHLQTDRTE